MSATGHSKLLTLGLTAVTAAIATVLVCERLEQHTIVPLSNGHVMIRDGSVVIEQSSGPNRSGPAVRSTSSLSDAIQLETAPSHAMID